MTKNIMFQGTGSDVGKSLVVAGICRALKRRGMNPVPFKPQNMSNNAGVTADGGEIGRAQMLQAKACVVPPTTDMSPVLLKPQSNMGSQVIVQGKVLETADSSYFRTLKPKLMTAVMESFNRLKNNTVLNDIVLIEGAGSPAEINLREGDIANMGFAEQADVPVVLVVDVDRGGSIASVVGTMAILPESEKARIKGYVINKFRGDVKLFQGALNEIEHHCGLKCFGVIPWFDKAHLLPAEDAVALDTSQNKSDGKINISVPRLPCIANFDDLDPLSQHPDVNVNIITQGMVIPSDSDVILLAGSKSTLGDLQYLKDNGWGIIIAHNRRGRLVMGICAGFQMLGTAVHDPDHVEGTIDSLKGLGLLDIETVMRGDKKLVELQGTSHFTNTKFQAMKCIWAKHLVHL